MIDPNFFIFLNGNICNLYSYLIPKEKYLILGLGDYKFSSGIKEILIKMRKFKKLLLKEIPTLEKIITKNPLTKRLAYIPFSRPMIGKKNIVLSGDAAGLINCFSGEGIRLALESGFYAAEAINESLEKSSSNINDIYHRLIKQIIDFTKETHKFALSLDDIKRENFIKNLNLI